MNPFLQPFKFPKRLWVLISAAAFLFLFFTVRIGLPGKFPPNFTAWKAVLGGFTDGSVFMGLIFSLFWSVFALAIGAFVAAILGVVRQFFGKSE